jgi:heme A synthase
MIVNRDRGASSLPVAQLRGAGVDDVDPGRLARFTTFLLVVVLAVLVIVLSAAGVRKNSQITKLRDDGVPVAVTITSCRGELGGSGSNAAGFVCRGAYRLGEGRYIEPLPGDTRYNPGTVVKAVAVRGDPQLVAPAVTVAEERPSAAVYVLPSVLLLALVVLCGFLLWKWRRSRARGDAALDDGPPPGVDHSLSPR